MRLHGIARVSHAFLHRASLTHLLYVVRSVWSRQVLIITRCPHVCVDTVTYTVQLTQVRGYCTVTTDLWTHTYTHTHTHTTACSATLTPTGQQTSFHSTLHARGLQSHSEVRRSAFVCVCASVCVCVCLCGVCVCVCVCAPHLPRLHT